MKFHKWLINGKTGWDVFWIYFFTVTGVAFALLQCWILPQIF